MRTAAPARIAFTASTTFIAALATIDLRLRAGDERGQAVYAVGDNGLRLRLRRLRLVLRLRAMFAVAPVLPLAAMFARLLVALIGLLVAVALVVARAKDCGCCCWGTKPGSWPNGEKLSPSSSLSSTDMSLSGRGCCWCCGWFCLNCSWAAAIRRK